MDSYFIVILLGLFIFLVISSVLLFLRIQHLQSMMKEDRLTQLNQTQQMIQTSMLQMHSAIHEFFSSQFTRMNSMQSQQLSQMEEKMNQQLLFQYEKTKESYLSFQQQMNKIAYTQDHLQSLQDSIQDLQKVFSNKKMRGIYGEVELYTLLEQVFGDNQSRYAKQYQLSNGTIVDAVIFGSKDDDKICVDAKFPLENYQKIFDEQLDESAIQQAKKEFEKDIRKHIHDIYRKYIIPSQTVDMAFMFIPAESICSYIYGSLPQVLNECYQLHVYIVSPTTLMVYLTALRALRLDQTRSQMISLIQSQLQGLLVELERFETRYQQIYSDFQKSQKDMNDLQITMGKLTQKIRSIITLEKKD